MRPSLLASLTAAALALCGCGQAAATDPSTPLPSPTGSTRLGVYQVNGPNLVATVKGNAPVPVRVEPAADTKPNRELSASRTRYGTGRSVLVLDRVDSWLQVGLPTRPNDQAGWVPTDRFTLTAVSDRISVNLTDRTIVIIIDGKTHRGPVAVGSEKTPTPTTGVHPAFVTDVLAPGGGAYGKFALGVSLHSEVLTKFGTGDAQVGIHGTNDQGSVGKAVTHGCIRVGADLEDALGRAKVGTPVTIIK